MEHPKFLKNIFDGDFEITQGFGEHPEVYGRFGLKGHNGIDFALPIGTRLFAGCKCKIIKDVITIEPDCYGNHLVARATVDGRHFELLWAHLDHIQLPGIDLDETSTIGLSGKSGVFTSKGVMLSEEEKESNAGHLHFGVREINSAGEVLNKDNGYNGYLDPTQFFIFMPGVPLDGPPVGDGDSAKPKKEKKEKEEKKK